MHKSISSLALTPLALALAGCGGDQPRPAIEVKTVYVDRVIPTPCVKREQIPMKPAKVGSKLNGDSAHDNAILGAALARMGAAFDEAAALLGACVGG